MSALDTRPRGVYTVTDRDGVRSTWTRIGVAFTNRDGSLTLRLDALPVSGVMQVLPAESKAVAVGSSTDDIEGRATGEELAALRAVIEGRTEPPTIAEIAAHATCEWLVDGAVWMVFLADGVPVVRRPECREVRGATALSRIESTRGRPWVPITRGRPCAWPVVAEVSR